MFRNIVQYGLDSSAGTAVAHETILSIPILFPPDFDTRYGTKVIFDICDLAKAFDSVRHNVVISKQGFQEAMNLY